MWNCVYSAHVNNNINIEVGESLKTVNKKAAFHGSTLCGTHKSHGRNQIDPIFVVESREKQWKRFNMLIQRFRSFLWGNLIMRILWCDFFLHIYFVFRSFRANESNWFDFIFSMNSLYNNKIITSYSMLLNLFALFATINSMPFYSIRSHAWNFTLLKRRTKKGFEKVTALTKDVPSTKSIIM